MQFIGIIKEDSNYAEDTEAKPFSYFQSIQNRLPKPVILSYLKTLPFYALAPGISKDFMTGEILPNMGFYQDGGFRFPVEFVHYYEKYDIGIPYDYENYLITERGLSA